MCTYSVPTQETIRLLNPSRRHCSPVNATTKKVVATIRRTRHRTSESANERMYEGMNEWMNETYNMAMAMTMAILEIGTTLTCIYYVKLIFHVKYNLNQTLSKEYQRVSHVLNYIKRISQTTNVYMSIYSNWKHFRFICIEIRIYTYTLYTPTYKCSLINSGTEEKLCESYHYYVWAAKICE